MNNDFSRGSEWRKWDLHLHTPSSYDYQNGSVTNEDIVNKLVENNIALAVITDHHFIDINRYFELKNLSQGRVTFLPGIELRTELGGSKSVHITAIFPSFNDKMELQDLWDKLKVKLDISETKVKEKGDDNIYVNFKDAVEVIKKLNGLVTIHSGKKSNSVENIKNSFPYKQALKTDIAYMVDFYEIGSEADIETYETRVFPDIDREIPLIIGSDNHNICDYQLKLNCWIKADPTFEGLKQAIVECKERISCKEKPCKLTQIELNKTKYIDKIAIGSNDSSECWFDQEIPLNSELVSIIGNKGNGKSALADILGLIANSKNFEYFSFLNDNKFYKSAVADKHYAKLKWFADGDYSKTVNLHQQCNDSEIEKVRYIPQSYFEKVCNLIDNQKDFKREIEKVIFRHLKDEDKQDANSFDELIRIKKENCVKEIENWIIKLKELIPKYVSISDKLLEQNLQLNRSSLNELANQKISIESKLLALDKNSVKKPISNDNSTKIKEYTDEITKITKDVEQLEKQKSDLTVQIDNLNDIKTEMQDFQSYYNNLSYKLFEKLKQLNIKFEDIITVKFDKTIIEAKQVELQKLQGTVLEKIDKNAKKVSGLSAAKNEEEKKLSGEEKRYQDYINSKTLFEQELKGLLGDKEKPLSKKETYYYYEYLCSNEYIDNLKEQKGCLFKEIQQISVNIFETYLDIRKLYEKLKENVDQFIREFEFNPNSNIKINFSPKIKILKELLIDNIMVYVDKQGNFRGDEKRDKIFNELCNMDLNNSEHFTKMLETLLSNLKNNLGNTEDTINKTLKRDAKAEDLYLYIFSAKYLDVDYELEFNDKQISMLSPGERGLLLLIFFLLADTSNIPLILDQPEENLDNQTIYNVLVQLIKNAKRKRQVIVVTHNPNLAVVCDSEQIICADFNTERKPKICYISGSIENKEINKKIVNVLEGTMPAFKNREDKYFYNNSN